MSTHPSLRKSINILLVSVLILQGSCRGWIEKPIVPDAGIAIPRRGLLRVTKFDGTVITLSDSFITNDSISGLLPAVPHQRMAIARTTVTKIEVRADTTPEGVRTAGKIYLGVVGAVAIVGFSPDAARARMAIARNNVSKIEVSGDTTPEGVRTAGKIYLGVVGAVAIVGMTLIAIALYGIGPQ